MKDNYFDYLPSSCSHQQMFPWHTELPLRSPCYCWHNSHILANGPLPMLSHKVPGKWKQWAWFFLYIFTAPPSLHTKLTEDRKADPGKRPSFALLLSSLNYFFWISGLPYIHHLCTRSSNCGAVIWVQFSLSFCLKQFWSAHLLSF